MIRVSTRNTEDNDVPEVKYRAQKHARAVNYTVQYRIPDSQPVSGRFRPDWLNKWCRHSQHDDLESALWNYRKEKRSRPKWQYRILDKAGLEVKVCETCGEPQAGLLCRRSFFDFITGDLVHA